MTSEQLLILKAHITANTDPVVVDALATGTDWQIAQYYNQVSATKAWRTGVSGSELFDAMNLTAFDTLTAGKRDAWRILLDFSPSDFTKAKIRKAVTDIWAAADATAILNICTEFALLGELVFGGDMKTEGSVSALKRNYLGTISVDDVSLALRS